MKHYKVTFTRAILETVEVVVSIDDKSLPLAAEDSEKAIQAARNNTNPIREVITNRETEEILWGDAEVTPDWNDPANL